MQFSGQIVGRDLANFEFSGGNIDRGQRDCLGRVGDWLWCLEERGQIIPGFGIEQAVFGQSARRHEAHNVAPHDRLGAAFARFGGVLELFADGDAKAALDQALQIFIGAMDWNAAHGDIVTEVFAALGQDNAKRFRGDLRIFEKKLVEIAHAIPQDAIGIGGLDFQELRHARCYAAAGDDCRRRLVNNRLCGARERNRLRR